MLAAMPAAEAIPASSCPCSIATATAAPTAPQMDVACRPRSKNTELRSSSSWPGAVFKNGELIERPDESEGGDQQVA